MARRKPTKLSGDFAQGIATPFREDHDGGLATAEGDAYIFNQVLAVVSPNDSDNAFQDLGGNEFPIFQNAEDPSWRSAVRQRIRRQFQILQRENLARLSKLSFLGGDGNGNFNVKVEYINIESQRPEEAQMTFNVAGQLIGSQSSIPGFISVFAPAGAL